MASLTEVKLVVREGQGEEASYSFTKDKVIIGRNPSCDVRLKEITAGREHVRLEVSPGGFVTAVDLGTSTGTKLNTIPVEGSILVSDGDTIQVGEASIRVTIRSSVAAAAGGKDVGRWSAFERPSVPVLNIAQVWADNVVAVKRFGRSSRHVLHMVSFVLLLLGLQAWILFHLFSSLREMYRVGQILDYGPAMSMILGCFVLADIVIVAFTLDMFIWPRESQAKNVIVGEAKGADFFVPSDKLGDKSYRLIETFEGKPALNLAGSAIQGKLMVGDQVLTVDQIKKTSLVKNHHYLPLTYKIRARIEIDDVVFILGLDPSMIPPKGAFLSRINVPMGASFALAFVLAGLFMLAIVGAPERRAVQRVSAAHSQTFRTLIRAAKQQKVEEEEKKDIEKIVEQKKEKPRDDQEELKKEEKKDPVLEVKEVKKKIVSPTQVKVTKTLDTSLKRKKTQKKFGPVATLTQAERKQRVRQTGALAALNRDGGPRMLDSDFGDESIRVAPGFRSADGLHFGGDSGPAGLDAGGSVGGDPFNLSEIEGQGGALGPDGLPGGQFGGSVGADGRLVDGKTRIGGGVAELAKKQVAGSVKSPKFTAEKLRVSPAGDFGMDGTGRLDKRIVRQYIQRQMASIRWCYQRSFQKNQELEGKISVQFIISANGSVISSKILSSSMGDAEMDECVASRILNWRFPAPEGGGVVKVNYPLVFRRQ